MMWSFQPPEGSIGTQLEENTAPPPPPGPTQKNQVNRGEPGRVLPCVSRTLAQAWPCSMQGIRSPLIFVNVTSHQTEGREWEKHHCITNLILLPDKP